MLGHFHCVDREHTAVVEVQRHDLEHVARPVRPQVESTNRGLGVDIVAEDSVSHGVPDVGIIDTVPSGTGVDTNFTHLNIVLQKCRLGKCSLTAGGRRPVGMRCTCHRYAARHLLEHQDFRVGRPGLEPGTYGLKVRSSAIELATPGLVVIWTEIRFEIEPIAWARLSVWSADCKGACLEAIKSRLHLQKVETPI